MKAKSKIILYSFLMLFLGIPWVVLLEGGIGYLIGWGLGYLLLGRSRASIGGWILCGVGVLLAIYGGVGILRDIPKNVRRGEREKKERERSQYTIFPEPPSRKEFLEEEEWWQREEILDELAELRAEVRKLRKE